MSPHPSPRAGGGGCGVTGSRWVHAAGWVPAGCPRSIPLILGGSSPVPLLLPAPVGSAGPPGGDTGSGVTPRHSGGRPGSNQPPPVPAAPHAPRVPGRILPTRSPFGVGSEPSPPGAQELAEGPAAPHLPDCEELGGTGWTRRPRGCTRKELGDVPCARREGAGHQQAGKCRAPCPGGKHPETTTPKPRGMGWEGCG